MNIVEHHHDHDIPAKVAACRLDSIESQAIFTAMLQAIARPGSIHHLPHHVIARMPSIMAPVMTLADVETRAFIMDTTVFRWQDATCDATGARSVDLTEADLVAITTESLLQLHEIFSRVRVGTAFAPELGARMFIGVPTLGDHEHGDHEQNSTEGVRLALTGPGIKGETTLSIGGLNTSGVEAWITANSRFPAGVDVWLTTDTGHIAGIPRSTTIAIVDSWSSQERI